MVTKYLEDKISLKVGKIKEEKQWAKIQKKQQL
jgi:hypothetical protein